MGDVCVCAHARVCVRVCVFYHAGSEQSHTHTHTHIYIYTQVGTIFSVLGHSCSPQTFKFTI